MGDFDTGIYVELWESVAPMQRENFKWERTCQKWSTEVEHRGGLARGSDEISVMDRE
jgi:hypothetical protein